MTDDDGTDPGRTRPGRRGGGLQARWHRASSARRLGTVAAAGLVAAALVVGAGLASQPVYPAGSPADGLVVDELRNLPQAEGWRIEPAELGVAGARPGCVDLRVLAPVADDVLVAATTPAGTAATSCADTDAQPDPDAEPDTDAQPDPDTQPGPDASGDRLIRVDPRSGTVRWSIPTSDVSDVVSSAGLGAWVADDGSTAVVGVRGGVDDGSDSATVARVDLETGVVAERRTLADGPVAVLEADDRQVLVETRTGGGGDRGQSFVEGPSRAQVTTLARDDLSRATWQTDLGVDGQAALVGDRVLVVLDGIVTLFDPPARSVLQWVVPLSRDAVPTVDGDLVLVELQDDGRADTPTETAAFRLAGGEAWRRANEGGSPPVVSGGCVLFWERASSTCVDRETGADRWTVTNDPDLGGIPLTGPGTAGQGDDVVLLRTPIPRPGARGSGQVGSGTAADERALLVLDALTGTERARVWAPVEASPVAVSRTVLYLATPARHDSDGDPVAGSVVAHDLADGRELWRLAAGDADVSDLQFWGGTLVAVGDDGAVTQLVDRTRVVG